MSARAERRRQEREGKGVQTDASIAHGVCWSCDRRTFVYKPSRLCETCLMEQALYAGLLSEEEAQSVEA